MKLKISASQTRAIKSSLSNQEAIKPLFSVIDKMKKESAENADQKKRLMEAMSSLNKKYSLHMPINQCRFQCIYD